MSKGKAYLIGENVRLLALLTYGQSWKSLEGTDNLTLLGLFTSDKETQYARLLDPANLFQPSLIFASKVRAYSSEAYFGHSLSG